MDGHAKQPSRLSVLSTRVTAWTGTSTALLVAVSSIVLWGVLGPMFHFSDTWQLVMNTATSIITFLMVFIIQRAQNKDSLAIQLKLNEIVAALNGADNALIDIEDLSEEQLRQLHQRYQRLAAVVGESAAAISTRGSDGREAAVLTEQRQPRTEPETLRSPPAVGTTRSCASTSRDRRGRGSSSATRRGGTSSRSSSR